MIRSVWPRILPKSISTCSIQSILNAKRDYKSSNRESWIYSTLITNGIILFRLATNFLHLVKHLLQCILCRFTDQQSNFITEISCFQSNSFVGKNPPQCCLYRLIILNFALFLKKLIRYWRIKVHLSGFIQAGPIKFQGFELKFSHILRKATMILQDKSFMLSIFIFCLR